MRMNNRALSLFMSWFVCCVAVSGAAAEEQEMRQQKVIMADGQEVATNRYVGEDVPDLRQKTAVMADGTEHAITAYEPIESGQAPELPARVEIDLQRTDFNGLPQATWDEDLFGINGLNVVYEGDEQLVVPLTTIKSPLVHATRYAVRTRVEYRDISAKHPAYLEMWSYFPDGTEYFTRTLADHGPMASMAGRSEWRDIELPFDASGKGTPPDKVIVNLVMPGPGKVTIAPTMELENLGPAPGTASAIGHLSWADLLGFAVLAIFVGILGLTALGLLIAALIAWSARRYRAGWICLMLAGGVTSLLWVPVLLMLTRVGWIECLIPLLGTVVLIVSILKLHRDREGSKPSDPDEELRKMRAMDVG